VIVTFDLKHFSPEHLEPWGVQALRPQVFLQSLWGQRAVPAAYSRAEPVPNETLPALPSPETIPESESEERPGKPLLPASWWQCFLHGNSDALLGAKEAQHAVDLITDKLGKEAGQLEINGPIRSCELRKKIYAEFGADLALHTMQGLWLEASSGGGQPNTLRVPDMPETVAKFLGPDEPAPPWRLESVEASKERPLERIDR